MGSGCRYGCSNCGFSFTHTEGVGFLFPKVYAETVQKAKDGALGEYIQSFFAEHEDGAINAEYVTVCCDECGHLSKAQDLTMFVPIAGTAESTSHGRWSVEMPFENANYVSYWDLEESYMEYAKYTHICEKCGSKMHVVSEDEILMCPKCKTPLEQRGWLMWD